jgi:hypothetical protein
MKYSNLIFTALAGLAMVYACNDPKSPQNKPSEDSSHVAVSNDDSVAMCAKPGGTIMDPNNPKPMALMMRQMAANADSMKHQIERGEKPDSLKYPFIRFYLVEPTDTSVLEPQFFENARLFQQAYLDLFRHPKEPVKYHNLVISKCIGCHENYCSGPLKRIKKLIILPEG